MFTMDDWLGLLGLILLVAVCLYVVYVVLTAIALVWARRQPERASQPLSEADIAATKVLSDAIGRLPLVLHTHDPLGPMTREEICELLQIDPSIGYYNFGADIGRVRDQVEQSLDVPAWMLRGDPPPAGPLATIVDDLRAAIVGEHLEIRTRNRFTAILNRLENYRDS